MNSGNIVSIRGVVVDIKFKENETPKIYDALIIEDKKLGKGLDPKSMFVSGCSGKK